MNAWLRITPACAGISASILICPSTWKDHPRVRGDKRLPSWLTTILLGSPPRARG